MYTFEITHDIELIKKTVCSPNNIPWAFDNTHKIEEIVDWNPLQNDKNLYISCYHNNQYMGIFGLFPLDENNTIEAHLAFLPQAYGKVSSIGKLCISWLWENTEIKEIIAPVVESNIKARRCVEHMGLLYFTKISDYWLNKENKLEDVVCYKISKVYNTNRAIEE